MKKNICYLMFFVLLLLISICNVNAYTYGGCEYSKVSRLKSIVSNINLSYDYYIYNDKAYFKVTINNLVPGIYFVDSKSEKKYNYSNSIDGEIIISGYVGEGGIYKFYSDLSECKGVKLGSKYYSFPYYNSYYKSDICLKNSTYSLCQKWTKVSISYDELEKKINEYNERKLKNENSEENIILYKKTLLDYIVEFYVKYYYIILIAIILVCVTAMVINKRKNRFDI